MTVVLVAVYVPIGFQGGLTGALFTEFAFTLVGAVTVSAIVALTLSPMMCSRLLKPHGTDAPRLAGARGRVHRPPLRRGAPPLRALAPRQPEFPAGDGGLRAASCSGSIYFLYTGAKSELAPQEDQGVIITQSTPAPNATLAAEAALLQPGLRALRQVPRDGARLPARPPRPHPLPAWSSRRGTSARAPRTSFSPSSSSSSTVSRACESRRFQLPPLPGSQGLPIQFVIDTTELLRPPQRCVAALPRRRRSRAACSSSSIPISSSTIRSPRSMIDRDKAAQLGLKYERRRQRHGLRCWAAVTSTISASTSAPTRSFRRCSSVTRLNAEPAPRLLRRATSTAFRFRSRLGGAHHHRDRAGIAQSLPAAQRRHHLGRGRARRRPGGCARTISRASRRGPCRRAIRSITAGSRASTCRNRAASCVTFAFALIIIFLSLAALFESFRDPLIILVSVPMSIAGALIFISVGLGGATLNIYTQVGLVTLDGADQQARHPHRRVRQRAAARKASPSARRSSRRPASGCGRS